VKSKAVVGIALGLRFAHGLGLLHGAVKASNILFDTDRRIQIADFSPIRLETGEVEPFSGKGLAPTADVSAFASLLFEIVVGGTATPPIGAAGGPPFPAAVPAFISRMIEDERSPESARCLSFGEIVAWLKANRFEIMAGVDSDEVSASVSRVESSEQAGEREYTKPLQILASHERSVFPEVCHRAFGYPQMHRRNHPPNRRMDLPD
jgi:serine/threonine protein kinase